MTDSNSAVQLYITVACPVPLTPTVFSLQSHTCQSLQSRKNENNYIEISTSLVQYRPGILTAPTTWANSEAAACFQRQLIIFTILTNIKFLSLLLFYVSSIASLTSTYCTLCSMQISHHTLLSVYCSNGSITHLWYCCRWNQFLGKIISKLENCTRFCTGFA